MTKSHTHLCVHGHFYQPPRENPWTEEIELQESAAPYHDWNERIFHECYRANARARVLDSEGKITRIESNFERMNFNVGPTLMSWLEHKHPETYQRILHSDVVSREQQQGHGNAIAQVYNHMILPLASRRDKVTQIKWGLADFRHRFKRSAISIWLPETACNEETLEVLIEAQMKYVILSPHQAASIRNLSKEGEIVERENWEDVSKGSIDPHQPYRCFLKKDPQKFIDIFFYDGPISKDIGFGDILFDAKHFMDRVDSARAGAMNDKMIHVATDGETYGHHKAYGERALAYVLNVEAKKRGFDITNYGRFLSEFSPNKQVSLIEGENGEGTSWSCIHGVARWKAPCGCRGDGPEEWRQDWRKPLRDSLDWLRDELAKIYEEKSSVYFNEPWKVRDWYIHVILNRSKENIENFMTENGKFDFSRDDTVAALKLLEMQRYAMLMYTSCGWFFTEISGIETVQILTYAARAIEFAREIDNIELEPEFLAKLKKAKSNLVEYKTGKGVYDKLVRPRMISMKRLVSFFVISSSINNQDQNDGHRIFCFDYELLYQRKENVSNITLHFGRIKLVSRITFEEYDFAYLLVQFGPHDFRCSVAPFNSLSNAKAVEEDLFNGLRDSSMADVFRKIDTLFGREYFSLRDLLLEHRRKIVSILSKELVEKISLTNEQLYDENKRVLNIYNSMNLPIPPAIEFAAIQTLERKVLQSLSELSEKKYDSNYAATIYRLIEDAKLCNISLNFTQAESILTKELEEKTKNLSENYGESLLEECMSILDVAEKIGIKLQISKAQDYLFELLKEWGTDKGSLPKNFQSLSKKLSHYMERIGFNSKGLESIVSSSSIYS